MKISLAPEYKRITATKEDDAVRCIKPDEFYVYEHGKALFCVLSTGAYRLKKQTPHPKELKSVIFNIKNNTTINMIGNSRLPV